MCWKKNKDNREQMENMNIRSAHMDWRLPLSDGDLLDEKMDQDIRQCGNPDALKSAMDSLGFAVDIKEVSVGPRVTNYELTPHPGIKVSDIFDIFIDLQLALAAESVRFIAPVPGKKTIGVEVPNEKSRVVSMREIVSSEEFECFGGDIPVPLGIGVFNNVVVEDLTKLQHLFMAGKVGAGVSVCLDSILNGILFKCRPEDVRLLLIDPKIVMLSPYNGIPHLMHPVITNSQQGVSALRWAFYEMKRRLEILSEHGLKSIEAYNDYVKAQMDRADDEKMEEIPRIVIVISDLADLMMESGKRVEDILCRLLRQSADCGIHLIVSTQRLSKDVITGNIKVYIRARIAFSTMTEHDSRLILDRNGAEDLVGRGDMLFMRDGYEEPQRIQGVFVSDNESMRVIDYWKKQTGGSFYDESFIEWIKQPQTEDAVTTACEYEEQ